MKNTPPPKVQRYSHAPVLKRSILELIANELLELAPPQLDPSVHGGTAGLLGRCVRCVLD